MSEQSGNNRDGAAVPYLKVEGSLILDGVKTPGGVLTAHISNDPHYPNISVRCDGVEVARVEYCIQRGYIQTFAYGDNNMQRCLDMGEPGIVPYIPQQE